MSCGKRHIKRGVRLQVRFDNAEPEKIVEAELCHGCGDCVRAKQLDYKDEGFYLIPSALAEVVEDL